MSDSVIFHEMRGIGSNCVISLSFFFILSTITGAPSVAIPDMMTKLKKIALNYFFTAFYKSGDLVMSFSGAKEAISTVLYLLSMPLIKMSS